MIFSKALLALTALAASPASALWPIPVKLSQGKSTLWIDQSVHVTYNGQSIPYVSGYEPPAGTDFNSQDIVQGGVARAFQHIFDQNFVPWKLRARDSNYEPSLSGYKTYVSSIAITQTGKDTTSTFKPTDGEVDESYSLDVSESGKVTIKAVSSSGVLHALETFSQLFFQHSAGNYFYTQDAPVSIEDKPQFSHRGVLFDVARNYYPVSDILRTIDAMSWNKLNRLHIHMTDSQSWPLQIPALPKLAEKGAYSPTASYSPDDLANIFSYGIARGVEVYIEIDMPGHIGVIQLAYEDLIVAYDLQPYYWYCSEPPCGAFQLNNSKVYDFLDTLFEDLLPRVAPYSAYFHTGGDELNANDSSIDPTIGTNSTKVLTPLLQKFVDFAHNKVRKAGLTPMCWEEMVTTWDLKIGSDVVVQSWLGGTAVPDLAKAGHKVIDSNYNYYYLDCGRGQWLNFPNAVVNEFYPFLDWCDPAKNWKLIYSHDPLDGVDSASAKNVVGGEVAIWSETIDPVTLDSLMWPRAGAAGEIWWSGRTNGQGHNRSQLEATPRMAEMRERMVARGVSAAPIQMIFCTQGNAEQCEYPA